MGTEGFSHLPVSSCRVSLPSALSPYFPPHIPPFLPASSSPALSTAPKTPFPLCADGPPRCINHPRVPFTLALSGCYVISISPHSWPRLFSDLTDNHTYSFVHAHPFSSHPCSYLLFQNCPDSKCTLFHDPFVIN